MGVKNISTTHELAAKQWAEGLEAETLLKISVSGLIGKGSDSVIQKRKLLEDHAGDRERVGLRLQDATAPKTSGQSVEGAEKTLRLKYMDVIIDEYAEAYRWENVMSRQRVTFEHRDEAKAALSDLFANAFDTGLFNQLAGMADPGGNATFQGHNPIVAPTAGNHLFGSGTTEATITTTGIMSLDLISKAKTYAKSGKTAFPIRKARLPGFSEPMFVCIIHPFQNLQMRAQDTRWDNICNSAMQGGMIGNNPMISGALGVWDETVIMESSRIPYGDNGTGGIKTRRALFLGAQAAVCSGARLGGTPDSFRWVEKLFDFDREMGVMGGFVAGLRKSVFSDEAGGANAVDFAVVVLSTASDPADVP